MVDRRLVEYLKLGRKKGVPFDVLKKRLLEKGHSAKRVEEAAKESGIKNYQYKPLVIVSIVILLILFSLVIQNLGKKTKVAVELTSEKQLSIINKALSEKYSNYKIKNYGSVVYDGKEALRAEVDLGLIDVCGQKIKADSSIIVVKDGKIAPAPLVEIENKAEKFGEVLPEKNGENATEIKKVNKKISNNCEFKDVYEIFIKLDLPYYKKVNSINDFGIGREPPQLPQKGEEVRPTSPPPAQGSPTLEPIIPLGDVKITHKILLIDELTNLIYTIEGVENNGNMVFLKGEFA